jgi:tetratricopeptide (TPR) repeat protein
VRACRLYRLFEGRGQRDNGRRLLQAAYQFIDAGHPREAIDLLNLAIKKDPNYYEAYYNRGVVFYLLKDYQKAVDDFSKAIAIDRKTPRVRKPGGGARDHAGERKGVQRLQNGCADGQW